MEAWAFSCAALGMLAVVVSFGLALDWRKTLDFRGSLPRRWAGTDLICE
jgi:hypothetical protein